MIIRVDNLSKELSTAAPVMLATRLDDLQGALMQLRDSNRREFGKLWKREPDGTQLDAGLSIAAPCDNYLEAQRSGPSSEAAKCECGYCSGRREMKRALRDARVPKTATGQAKTARDNGAA